MPEGTTSFVAIKDWAKEIRLLGVASPSYDIESHRPH
jgi:hypothetical protein